MQAAENFESEETKNLILQMTSASESVIVGDKQTLRRSLFTMNFRVYMLRCWMKAEPLYMICLRKLTWFQKQRWTRLRYHCFHRCYKHRVAYFRQHDLNECRSTK